MERKTPFFAGQVYFSIKDNDLFSKSLQGLIASTVEGAGFFAGDNLITWAKSLGWNDDVEFANAFNTHATDAIERTIVWRTVTLAWAVRQALKVDGDFVECGCYKGTTARILYDVAKLAESERRFFLYDLFFGAEGTSKHAMPAHGPALEAQVRARFAEFSNVIITQGKLPESLEKAAPEKIAFMHIDLNNVAGELGALNALFDRVSPGGVIVLDDYGWRAYHTQQVVERAWFAERGYVVLELPTGQGMVIR